MKNPIRFALILALAGSLASPVMADNDRGRDKHHRHKHDHGHHDRDRHDRHDHRRGHDDHRRKARWDCPPGLVEIGRSCIPPGQLRKHARHHPRVGDVLRRDDYRLISDPRRYNLPQQGGWNYYRDDNQIYRVDSSTRKILAVMELVSAFSN